MKRASWPATLGGAVERRPWSMLAVCLAIGALVSVWMGQDANWDLLNYHLYDAWAWWHGRLHTDLAVAGPQTYFNPLLDLPYYLMTRGPMAHWPRLIAALQGLWYGVLIFVVWRLVATLARAQSRDFDIGDIAALLIGVTGSAVIAQAGTTFNEIPLAVLILAALLLLLRGQQTAASASPRRVLWHACLAGALAGLAAGLKPTAVIYLPALALTLLLRAPKGRRWALASAFSVAAGLAFLIAYGGWGWWLYRTTGNPIFPLFNNIFHSDWIPATNGADSRFRPTDVWQWVLYPFYWTLHRSGLVSEPRILDGRFAFAWLAGALMLLQWVIGRMRRSDPAARPARALESFVLLFVLTGYVCWLVVFSILRYAIPIEALTGVIIVMAVRRLCASAPDKNPARKRQRLVSSIAVGLALLLILSTHHPNWGRVDYGTRVFAVQVRPVPAHSLILFVDQPSAYLVPFFHARDLEFVGVTWFTGAARGHRLWAMTQQRIEQHHGPIYAVLGAAAASQRGLLPLLGLTLTADCVPVKSNLQPQPPGKDPATEPRVCRVIKSGA